MMATPDPRLQVQRSPRSGDWSRALQERKLDEMRELARQENPGSTLYYLEAYINGLYRGLRLAPSIKSTAERLGLPVEISEEEIRSRVAEVQPLIDEIRENAGWDIRDFDLSLLRQVRDSSVLSLVLGAGVSMGAGAPSWPDLVRALIERILKEGVEFREPVPTASNPPSAPIEWLPDGSMRIHDGKWSYKTRVREVRRFSPDQQATAFSVLEEVRSSGARCSVETLMHGAQICHDLCGQELFRLVTSAIYRRANAPSLTHQAIAKLARPRQTPGSETTPSPGLNAIITYNFDALMSEALEREGVPHVAYAISGDELLGDPDRLAQKAKWAQPVFHLHGYTPRRPFLITNTRFVFSTSQYLTTYSGPPSKILDLIRSRYLANPVHIALYVGCSFMDEAMNRLLRDAFVRYPGRYHYALLQWPHDRQVTKTTPESIKAESAKYLEFGVRPIWFDRFDELPDLIGRLE